MGERETSSDELIRISHVKWYLFGNKIFCQVPLLGMISEIQELFPILILEGYLEEFHKWPEAGCKVTDKKTHVL